MNTVEVKANWFEARTKYAEYLKAVRSNWTQQDVALKNAYREIMRGNRVLDLAATLRAAGLDPQGRPRLAIIAANHTLCWFSRFGSSGLFSPRESDGWRGRPARGHVSVDLSVWAPGKVIERRCRAVVPTIPPLLRPAHPDRYWILWEAEWETVPGDPFLLRRLGCGLYMIVAQWDLTPLEQAVLANSTIRSTA